MKKIFIAALLLAMFVALTGGYGQVINSDWVTRSFTSAVEETSNYPQLIVNTEYAFRVYRTDGYERGTVLEQNGPWVLIGRQKNGDTWDYINRINLDNIAIIHEKGF